MEEQKWYYEDRKVKGIREVEEFKTPAGDKIFELSFDTGEPVMLTRLRWEATRTHKASDASKARETLVKEAASKLYAILMEYGLKLSEVDPTINQAVGFVNAATEATENVLWDVRAGHERTMLQMNTILMKKYGKPIDPTTT